MHRRFLVALIAALSAISLLATAALAGDEPEFIEQRVWTQCSGTTPVGNVNLQVFGEPTPTWSTDEPATSVTDGDGCGVVDPAFLIDTDPQNNGGAADLSWTGTYTGNLDTIEVEAHFLGQLPLNDTFTTQLWIDGAEKTPGETQVQVIQQASETGASSSVRFAFNSIGLIDDYEGPGTVEHTITLRLRASYVDTATAVAWVWGTTEVPAGLTFNADVGGLPTVRV